MFAFTCCRVLAYGAERPTGTEHSPALLGGVRTRGVPHRIEASIRGRRAPGVASTCSAALRFRVPSMTGKRRGAGTAFEPPCGAEHVNGLRDRGGGLLGRRRSDGGEDSNRECARTNATAGAGSVAVQLWDVRREPWRTSVVGFPFSRSSPRKDRSLASMDDTRQRARVLSYCWCARPFLEWGGQERNMALLQPLVAFQHGL